MLRRDRILDVTLSKVRIELGGFLTSTTGCLFLAMLHSVCAVSDVKRQHF